MPRRGSRASSSARVSSMEGSFLRVIGYGSPTDTEHGFPAPLKAIWTEASEIFPEEGPPGVSGVAARAGPASGGRDRPADRVCFAHVAPRRVFRASVTWFAASNEPPPLRTDPLAQPPSRTAPPRRPP